MNANSNRKSRRAGRVKAALLRRLGAGARNESGAAAVMFAGAMLLMMPLTLGLVDVYMASTQRNQLQDALDAAALYAARSLAQTSADIDAVGDKSLKANLNLPAGVTLIASNFALSGSKVVAHAETTASGVATDLWPHPNITADAEVQRAMDKLEIALVLDNTGSMSGTKISTLITQSKILVDKLSAAAARSTDPNPIKISLVPFSMTVRVQGSTDTSVYNTATHAGTNFPTWIDPLGKAHTDLSAIAKYDTFAVPTDRFAMLKAMNKTPWAGCVESRRVPYDIQEDAPSPALPATMFVPYFWPDEPGVKGSKSPYGNSYLADGTTTIQNPTWKDVEQNPAKYTGTPQTTGTTAAGYTFGPNSGCTMQPLIRLSTNMTAVKTAIGGMVAVGDTNIPMGLVWGWHTLSPNGPFADGAGYSTLHNRKIIILMTDGTNTSTTPGSSNLNTSYYNGMGYIWQNIIGITSGNASQRQAAMDARMAALCTNIKAKNITIYTIRVEDTSGSSALLKNCASTPDKFFDVQNVSTLGAAFDAIAGSIDNLRITK